VHISAKAAGPAFWYPSSQEIYFTDEEKYMRYSFTTEEIDYL
jgi:hypothetical protein